jgi:hypothetical protein
MKLEEKKVESRKKHYRIMIILKKVGRGPIESYNIGWVVTQPSPAHSIRLWPNQAPTLSWIGERKGDETIHLSLSFLFILFFFLSLPWFSLSSLTLIWLSSSHLGLLFINSIIDYYSWIVFFLCFSRCFQDTSRTTYSLVLRERKREGG